MGYGERDESWIILRKKNIGGCWGTCGMRKRYFEK